ncbi:MAG: DUF2752 domain-containing protein [Candidatus Poribacteria bacterium]|nr:DUF2752 domain-containing protein [Candidatus Poribacteria bacterium]
MFNRPFLSRLFLIGLGVVRLYTAGAEIVPEEVSLIPCLFHLVTDVPCPGCGMTRACLAITQGHFEDAWHYHPFSFLIIGLAIGMAFFPIRLKNVWTRCSPSTRNLITIGGIVLCLSVWIHRLWT